MYLYKTYDLKKSCDRTYPKHSERDFLEMLRYSEFL